MIQPHPYDSLALVDESEPEPAKAPQLPRFEVEAKLNLKGVAEFTGTRHHPDRAPTSGIRVCGIDVQFDTPAEAERFAAAAQVMAAQHQIAWERTGHAQPRQPAASLDTAGPR